MVNPPSFLGSVGIHFEDLYQFPSVTRATGDAKSLVVRGYGSLVSAPLPFSFIPFYSFPRVCSILPQMRDDAGR